MTPQQKERIEQHGKNLLAIFTNATERDPIALCKKLRRLERDGESFALRLCNGPEFASEDECDSVGARILRNVNELLGNDGKQSRLECPKCGEHNKSVRRHPMDPAKDVFNCGNGHKWKRYGVVVPVILNRDPRGYALKIDDEWMRAHSQYRLHTDWGGYGIIAPEIEP